MDDRLQETREGKTLNKRRGKCKTGENKKTLAKVDSVKMMDEGPRKEWEEEKEEWKSGSTISPLFLISSSCKNID